ncbi:hypothetical protein E2C01_075076 [Portunus trituberculatus]|uniref:Uncharacterized protein n=1 Tax=Portunus trituberculatus TaxID=210409 RepID=A0A5B7IEV9_PORTR|nr:hypothetical protein [Portunus trituberculatus]
MIGRKKAWSVKRVLCRGSVLERNACSHRGGVLVAAGTTCRDAAPRQGLRYLIETVMGKSSHGVRLHGVAFLHEDTAQPRSLISGSLCPLTDPNLKRLRPNLS